MTTQMLNCKPVKCETSNNSTFQCNSIKRESDRYKQHCLQAIMTQTATSQQKKNRRKVKISSSQMNKCHTY